MSRTVAAPTKPDSGRGGKFESRRAELADATLATLGEFGYARTSLREIAQRTSFSHGVLHYYFQDKTELITYCVRRYKQQCVTRYDEIILNAPDAATLAQQFADALATTLSQDTAMHRLWYDIRARAMFEQTLQPTVQDLDNQLEFMVVRVLQAYCAHLGTHLMVSRTTAYSVLDGIFEGCLYRYVAGDVTVLDRLRTEVPVILTRLVP